MILLSRIHRSVNSPQFSLRMSLPKSRRAIARRLGWTVGGLMALTLGFAGSVWAEADGSAEALSISQLLTPTAPKAQTVPTVPTQVVSGVAVAPPAAPMPEPEPFSPVIAGIVDLSARGEAVMSLGHLRPANAEALGADNVGWLKSMVLPLYLSPGGDHWGWIYRGWLIPNGQTYLAIGRDAGFAMIRSYENLYTFPVLEVREDGWFRVQYTSGGSAWAHSSQLELGDVPLVVEGWESRLQSQDSVYFLERDKAQALRSQPELSARNMLSWVPPDSLIEPISFQGDWMQVRVTRPVVNCRPLGGATVAEGWMRWRGEENETLAWYRPAGGCG